jgi:hypothetical protein
MPESNLVTDTARIPHLPPVAQQPSVPRGDAKRRKVEPKELFGHSAEFWKHELRRCPETVPGKAAKWLADRGNVAHKHAYQVVECFGFLERRMPDDFIDAVFGTRDLPCRRALTILQREFVGVQAARLTLIDDAIGFGAPVSVCIARPAADGIVVSVTLPCTTNARATKKTEFFTLRADDGIAKSLADALKRAFAR